MPDVGVLNLQIRDDSAKAAEGLGRLASSLKRVQQALGSDQKINAMATYIKKLNQAVATAIPEESISRMERLAKAIDTLNKAGGINIKGLKGLETATKATEKVKSAVGDNMADGFEHVESKVQQTKESIQETVQATKELYKATNQVRQATGHMSQFNPKTGQFEATPFANTQEWLADQESRTSAARDAYNESRDSSFASARARELADMRGRYAHAPNKTKETVAQAFGMSVDEMFPKAAAIRESADAMQEMSSTVQGVAEAAQASGSSMQEVSNTMQEAEKKSVSFKDKMKEAWSALKGDGEDVSGAKKKLTDMFGAFGKLLDQFARVARYRAIRAVLKQITDGFREGVQNYKAYSEQIGSSFAPAMESATSALAQMKNSIGAAAAPVIQELIPYLRMAVSWFVTAINYVNQFFALLRGQSTWSKAVEVTGAAAEDTAKSVKRVGGAAKDAKEEMKDLLADFDELNIIQSESGSGGSDGGGGGGVAAAKAVEETVKMFQEENKFSKFLKNNMEDIVDAAKLAGAAILGWRISSSFAGVLGTLGALVSAGALIGLVFKVSTIMSNQYMKTKNAGWLVGDVLATLVGGVLAKKVLTKVLGASAANIAIPIAFSVSSFATIKAFIENADVSALSTEGIMTAITGAVEGGAAAGYLMHMTGSGLASSLAGGAGTALITFGVAVGLKAIRQVFDTGELSPEVLKTNLLSSLGTGAGLAVLAASAGVGLAGTLALAGGGALATLGLLVGIEAIVTKHRPKKVMWGDSELTNEQIEAWVNEKMFGIDVTATVKQIHAVIDDVNGAKESIAQDMAQVTTDLNIIKLGLAKEDTYDSLRKSLFGENGEGGVIQNLKTYAEKQKVVIKTSMTLLPLTSGGTGEMLGAGLSGWDEVSSYMDELGNQLAEALKKGSVDGLKGYDDELIASLTEQLNNVQQAVTGAQLSSGATGNLLKDLSGLSQGDAQGALDAYQKYMDELKSGYNDMLTQELASYQQLEAFYLARGQEGDDKKAAYYRSLADQLVSDWSERLETGIKNSEGPGKKALAEALGNMLRINPEDLKNSSAMSSAMSQQMMNSVEIAIRNSDMKNSADVQSQLTRWLDSILQASLTAEDYKIVSDSMEKGLLSYADLFSQEAIDAILSGWQGEDNQYKKALKDAWANLLKESLNNAGNRPDVTETGVGGTPKITGSRIPKNAIIVAGVPGAGAAGFSNSSSTTPQQLTVSLDDSKQKNNIKDGTNGIQVAINALLDVARAINRKQFTVNITPSTGLGRVNRKSSEAYEKISGDYIGG